MAPASTRARTAFVVVLLTALAVRLWQLSLAPFGYDEGVMLHFAEDLWRLGKIPLSGPISSVGLSTSPHFIYLIAPFVALSRDPTVTAAAIGVSNALAVGVTMVVGWRAFGPWVGIMAGAFLCINPLAVAFSRRIWPPDVLPLLSALILLGLDQAVVARRPSWAAGVFPLATLATLVHPSFATLLPLLLAPLALLVLGRRWGHLLAAVSSSALIALPYVVYEFQTSWQDYPNYRYYSSLRSFVDLDALRWLLAVTTGWMLPNDGVTPPPQRVMPDWLVSITAALALLLLVLGLVWAVLGIVRSRAGSSRFSPSRLRLVGLVLWLGLPVLFSIRHWQPLFLHYFAMAPPAACLVMALAVAGRTPDLSRLSRLARLAARPLAATVVALQTYAIVGGTIFESRASSEDPCLMTSLATAQGVADEVIQLGQTASADHAIVELDSGAGKAMAYLLRGHFASVYLPETRLPGQTPTLVGDVGLGSALPATGSAPITLRQPARMTASVSPEAQFADGITLHQARFSPVSTVEQFVRLAITWSVDPSVTSTGNVAWRISLADSSGQPIAADAGDSQVVADLSGHRLVSWFWFDPRRAAGSAALAPGPYEVGLQLLDRSTIPEQPLTFSDASHAAEQTVRLPIQMAAYQPCDLPSVIP